MTSRRTAVTVLGSTGSIGESTLDVLVRNADYYEVFALSANRNVDKLREQCLRIKPRFAVMNDPDSAEQLRKQLSVQNSDIEVLSGRDGLEVVAAHQQTDTVVAGIVGAAGLLSTLAAVDAGKRLLLANKEALVMTGDILLSRCQKSGATLLPVDSEHNALFQCMPQNDSGAVLDGVDKILLTASGGPFRGRNKSELAAVTPEDAVAHPNWDMGRKISVDSATLMNKGLEVIEACYLFNIGIDQIEVVVHPESVIHSLVSYRDGSVLAQMGNPDMRTPIAHALAWPKRVDAGVTPLDLFDVAQLNFEKPDTVAFPCLQLAYVAMVAGGTSTAILNAANEVAVERFLQGEIGFNQIPDVISYTLEHTPSVKADNLDTILAADGEARVTAFDFSKSLPKH